MTRGERLLTIGAIRRESIPLELRFGVEGDQALAVDQSDQDAHGEGAAAEPERPDAIVGVVVAAQKFVEVEHIALHADPKGEPEHAQDLDARRTDAIAEDGDLASIRKVDRLIQAPDVRLERLRRAVACAVGKNDQVS